LTSSESLVRCEYGHETRAFPKLWFSIGRQAHEYERRKTARHWIFGVLILGTFLSVVGSLIANYISKR
jgi:hypothetical protein